METGAATAPDWVLQEVLPNVEGPVRSVHMITAKTALVFSQGHALFAEKGGLGGVKLYRVDYPAGFLVNGANCPHCGQPVQEPVGKIAHLVTDAPSEAPRKGKAGGKRRKT